MSRLNDDQLRELLGKAFAAGIPEPDDCKTVDYAPLPFGVGHPCFCLALAYGVNPPRHKAQIILLDCCDYHQNTSITNAIESAAYAAWMKFGLAARQGTPVEFYEWYPDSTRPGALDQVEFEGFPSFYARVGGPGEFGRPTWRPDKVCQFVGVNESLKGDAFADWNDPEQKRRWLRDNLIRASWGREALQTFMRVVGEDDVPTALQDLLSDLMHLAWHTEPETDFLKCLALAFRRFHEELMPLDLQDKWRKPEGFIYEGDMLESFDELLGVPERDEPDEVDAVIDVPFAEHLG